MAVRTGFAPTDDGQQLYWRTVGSGPPMICCNGVGVSTFFYKYIAAHFSDRFTVVLWDYRGHGRSTSPDDPATADLTIARCAKDLEAVRASIGITEPAVLFGHSMGCQVILEYTRMFPANVCALVPMLGTFARPLDTFMDSPYSLPIFRLIKKLADLGGKSGTRALLPLYANPLAFRVGGLTGMVDKYYAPPEDIGKYMEHLVHMDPRIFLRMVELMADHDMEDYLPDVPVPTLVIAAENDIFTPLHRSRVMAERIPGAELMVLAEASHAAIVEHPETINRRVDRFLAEHHLSGR
ncbi:MAG: alpha/beta hydrolase [Alphaproteobacteria bacterium]|nr:alpha/beta hydrolase [Alphaproteobacteria bacterium]